MVNQRVPRRPVSGVLLLDKGLGESSNQALQHIKRLYRAEKTGHTGTLDPLASGLLPLMFGEATKFAADLIDADKTYEARLRLGFSSTTGDAEGALTAVPFGQASQLTLVQLQGVAQGMLGEQEQVPPMFSALKKDGKPLYEYARQGVEVERKARSIHIHRMDVTELTNTDGHHEVVLSVTCSKGTYVRTLAEDFAGRLGTSAYLTGLRRTAIGALSVAQAYTVAQLKGNEGDFDALDALLSPVDALLSSLPALHLDAALAKRFSHGQRVPVGEVMNMSAMRSGRVRVYASQQTGAGEMNGSDGQAPSVFMGTGNLETDGRGGLLRPERLIQGIL